ncbi:MAG: hypothetical protein OXT65_05795 [Alphaproteobacteria bacterium]|nr:hypothetical protein [Alphaproteobacteria bacterium]
METGFPDEPSEAHFQICDQAADILGATVDGNGLKANQLRLAKHDTSVYPLTGEISVTLSVSVREEERPGKNAVGPQLDGRRELQEKLSSVDPDVLNNPALTENIMGVIANDPGKGWALDNTKIRLKEGEKTYCVFEDCKSCAGRSWQTCIPCDGTGLDICLKCNGTGQIQNHNTGNFETCFACKGRERVQCMPCKGTGRILCTTCKATGSFTVVANVFYEAVLEFIPDDAGLDDNVRSIIAHFTPRKMATDGHAEIFADTATVQEGRIHIPLMAHLPVGLAEFQIAGKTVPAVIAGLNANVVEMEPFLDAAIKPGIVALTKISSGPMASGALIQAACRFRLLRRALADLESHTKKRVYYDIKDEYGAVMSDKYLQAAVKYADLALHKLGDGPRLRGFAIGTAVAGVLYALYFFMGAHATLAQTMATHIMVIDLAVLLAGFIAAYILVRMMATKTLQRILPPEIAPDGKHMAPAGVFGAYAFLATLLLWLMMALAAPDTPAWLADIVSRIKG